VDERRTLMQNSKGADLGRDAFTMLVQANEDETAKHKLDKQELVCALRRFVCYTLTFLPRLEMSTLCSSLDMVRRALFADVAFVECSQKRLRHPLPLQLRI
jgi:hypothetical protein